MPARTWTPFERVLGALTVAGCAPERTELAAAACCPNCGDGSQSLCVVEIDLSGVQVACGNGCTGSEVLYALGLEYLDGEVMP